MSTSPVTLIASGDLRLSANQACWPAQEEAEAGVARAIRAAGYQVERGHPYQPAKEHGFIDSQRYGMDVFAAIDATCPLVVVCAAWQYSHHVLAGLISHDGPVLTCANWSGAWPGIVGMLNLNGCLTKAGVPYSTLWSADFEDEWFRHRLQMWLEEGSISHEERHIRPASAGPLPEDALSVGRQVADDLQREKAILGVFDEGCMGMYNAIIPDALLHATGVFKERLSQSALYHETMQVPEAEAERCFQWLVDRGMTFSFGDGEEALTKEQVLGQLRMYVAAVRMADTFGCDAIGIQYQQGLQDLLPASDLAEGLLNNVERPPVYAEGHRRELFAGEALPHFNEVDECAGLDALVTYRLWRTLGYDPETTLHDVRWGADYEGVFTWVLEISGAVPPNHLAEGYASAVSERQPPMYFRRGGGTIKGVSKPGTIVWSRVYVVEDALKADIGWGEAVALPPEETQRRWNLTTPQWPMMHAQLAGVSRNQMMARHKSNHIQVAYVPGEAAAQRAMAAKAVAFERLGITSYFAGSVPGLDREVSEGEGEFSGTSQPA